MISVIIPTYNDTKKLKQALESVMNQTYKDVEVIVVDDDSDNVVSEKLDVSGYPLVVSIFRLEQNSGPQVARNYGFKQSKGEYVIFWDADVVAQPTMLEKMLNVLEIHPEASYTYARHHFGFKKFPLQVFNAEDLKKKNFAHTTSLIRREHFPGFDESVKRLQDWDLWLTMLEQEHTGVLIPEYLFTVQTGGTMSNWLPKYAYMKPFVYLLPKKFKEQTQKYKSAVEIIQKKHNLN